MNNFNIKLPDDVQFIIHTLQLHGFEAYAVGGCVRDSILGREPGDWDITTSAMPEETKALFDKTFDTGISQVKIEEITLDELSNALPKSVFDKMMQHVKNRMEEQEEPSFRMTMRSKETFFNIEVEGHSEPKVTTIRLHHNKTFYEFGFDEESDGTRRLFDLMDMLLNKREDVLYVVDELERSLHPKLTERFLQLFMQLHDEQRMQLLFTTHESSIMDQAIFRRDEIWFVERNAENASSIYSLDRFKERYDKVLSKAYLEGRYGAIPVFSTFDFARATSQKDVLAQTPDDCCDSAESISVPREEE